MMEYGRHGNRQAAQEQGVFRDCEIRRQWRSDTGGMIWRWPSGRNQAGVLFSPPLGRRGSRMPEVEAVNLARRSHLSTPLLWEFGVGSWELSRRHRVKASRPAG